MKECSKAVIRRSADINFANRYFAGSGIDIGGAPDPLWLYQEFFPRMGPIRVWDLADGDAQFMAGVADETFDFVHSSHCLEHLHDPFEGLRHWFRIIKPGGYVIVTIPEEDMYEQGVFPSVNNPDHKSSFTMFKTKSWSPHSVNVLELVQSLGEAADIQKLHRLDSTFRYGLPRFDQTTTPIGECAIEMIIRKRTPAEIERGGRLPDPTRGLTREAFTLLTGHTPPG
ncbi:MAG: SAM-dependent methyltransferase [Rhodospirillales bacterium 20-60-12]|nr:MAG: SAM-dependent methyltransferase [Rhodospirillales bacterium 20-60-12]HQT67181.1 methyltransferase domain-containing protein [Acetobacteraceae bacterium]